LDLPIADQGGAGTFKRRIGRLPFRLVAPAAAIGDVLLILIMSVAAGVGYQVLFLGTIGNIDLFLALGALVAVNSTALMSAQRNYQPVHLLNFGRQLRYVTINWTSIFLILTAVAFALKTSQSFSRGSTISFFAGGLIALAGYRGILSRRLKTAMQAGAFGQERVILLAEHGQYTSSRAVAELRKCGYLPVRVIEFDRDDSLTSGGSEALRATVDDAVRVVQSERIDFVFLLAKWDRPHLIQSIVSMLRVVPTPVHLLPDENVISYLGARSGNIGTTFTVELQRAPLSRTEQAAKRLLDIVIAAVALVSLAPVMLLTALLIKLDSSGPVLFRQKRNGFNGIVFTIYKFRSMHILEEGDRIKQATRNDPRVTKIGAWIRRTSIDELPQLFNVLLGNMSLVGPRPHAIAHNTEYQQIVSNYAFRHHVKPGITGWAQVNGLRGETQTIDKMERRIDHDIWYINHWSIWLDFRIIAKTMLLAFRQADAY